MNGKSVNDIAIDYQNGVWVSTNGSGVYRLESEVPALLRSVDAAYPIIFGQKMGQGILIANSNAELSFQKDNKLARLKGLKAEVPIASCIKGNILTLAFSQKIFEYDLSEDIYNNSINVGKERLPKCPKINEIVALGGDTLVGVWRRGLFMFEKNATIEGIDFQEKIVCSFIHADTVWFGTEKGLSFYPVRWKGSSKRNGSGAVAVLKKPFISGKASYFQNQSIAALCYDSIGRLWVGNKTKQILVLHSSKIYTLASPPGEIINNISIGSEIIVSTNHGAFLLNGDVVYSKEITWEPIFKGEVLKCIQVGDAIYFQTGGAFSFSSLKKIHSAENNIIFNWIGLSFDSIEANLDNNFLVHHSSEEVKFKFERITYKGELPDIIYDLEGPVNSEGSSRSAELIFSRLVPGQYTLTARPNLYPINAKKIIINFKVLPEWHETWWSILIIIFLVLGFVAVVIYVVIKRNREKILKKNEQEQLLLEYKMIALKAQVNPHFISNCLTAIQNLIAKGESEKANLYVAKFGLLVRKILDYSSMSLITIEEELQVVKLYIQMEEVRFGKVFDFKQTVSDDMDPTDSLLPSLLLNPIIENSIWHGLLPLPKNEIARLEINISKEGNALIIIVRDNGVGLAEKKLSEAGRKSYGLDITEQRIKNINYMLHSTVGKFEIKNRQNEQGVIVGVEVIVCLPIENKY